MEKRQFTAEYKARIILEVLREEATISEIASREGVSRPQLQRWKKEFLENAPQLFCHNKLEKEALREKLESQEREVELMKKVGQLTLEVDWLKKICSGSRSRLGNKIWFQKMMNFR